MDSIGCTYTFRSHDRRMFRVPPGFAAVVGRGEGRVDVSFPHPSLALRLARLVNDGDRCVIECLMNNWFVRINGHAVPTTGAVLYEGDKIELVAGVTLIVGIEVNE